MNSFSDGICPLCSEVLPREQLHRHITSEHPLRRSVIIKVIQAHYPGWMTEHGACSACWQSFRDAGQILKILEASKRKTTVPDWGRTGPEFKHPPSGVSKNPVSR